MTAVDILAKFALPPRDRWGRPLVTPPDGGKAIAYQRISTRAKALDDQSGLSKWKMRQVVRGLGLRPDLVTLARSCGDDKRALADIAEQAMDAAGSSAAANTGTALHSFCEALDLGEDVNVPEEYRRDIEAYRKAMAGLTMLAIEGFVVVDEIEAAGSFDRLVQPVNLPLAFIGDIKSGADAPKYSVATSAQMAMYAHGLLYDIETGDRSPLPGRVSLDTGLLIHLPAGQGRCDIWKVDLDFGWQMATCARDIIRYRKHQPASLAWSAEA